MFEVGKQAAPFEIQVYNAKRELVDVEVTGMPIKYERRPAVLAIFRNISARKRHERELERLAYYDALTGLPNRSWFDRHAFRLFKQIEQNKQKGCLLSVNFDMFKHVNDSFGYQFGDLLLQEIAKRLTEDLDAHSHCVRMSGNEFALLLLDVGDKEEAIRRSGEILEKFRKPIPFMGIPFHSTCSIGIAMFPEHGFTSYKLLKAADIALNHAKINRNCAVMFEPVMEKESIDRLTMINDIHNALEQGWFELHYQPQFHMETGKLAGTEALIRLNHPRKGRIPPSAFIPVAETSSLIVPIGKWVLQEACMQNVRWQQAGMAPMKISVNIAMRQFQEDDFVDSVLQALNVSGMAPELLELEITESCVSDVAKLEQVLQALKPLGIQVSIDDFGTGYSSLSQLNRLEIDKLKIDRSFIEQMTMHEKSENLVRTIINMAHSLNIQVVAEGIETSRQAEMLRHWDCDIAQGFHFAKPQTPDQILDQYASAN
jgi:diguanylate cyclase (GGDEF)-like protein